MKARTSMRPGKVQWWQPKRYRIIHEENGSALIVFSSKINPRKVAKDFFGDRGFLIKGSCCNQAFVRVHFSDNPDDFQDFPFVQIDTERTALYLKPKSTWVFHWAATVHLEYRWLKSVFPGSFKAD